MQYDRDRRPPRRRPDDRRPGPDRFRPSDRPGPRYERRPYNAGPRPPRQGAPDEGGMSIRLDPRHLGTLRALASEAGVRPGELVTIWVTERIDAERRGAPSPLEIGPVLESLNERIEALARRVDQLAGSTPPAAAAAVGPGTPSAAPRRRGRKPRADSAATDAAPAAAPRRRGRPARKTARTRSKNPAVPLHDEIAAVLADRGPLGAADLAAAIAERGIYAPPRSGKPLDATSVSVRVSNPRYRSRFTRSEGKIGLA